MACLKSLKIKQEIWLCTLCIVFMYNLIFYANKRKRHIRLHGAWGTYQCKNCNVYVFCEWLCVITLFFDNLILMSHHRLIQLSAQLCETCRECLLVKLVLEDVTSHLLYGLINVTAKGVFSEIIVFRSGIFCSCTPEKIL